MKVYVLFLLLLFIAGNLISCNTGSSFPTVTNNSGPSYVVSPTGERTNPSDKFLTTEYSHYYIKSSESRDIFVGGKMGNGISVWIDVDGQRISNFISTNDTYTMNNDEYFGTKLTVDISGSVGNIPATLHYGTKSGDVFTDEVAPYAFVFEILPWDYKKWSYDIFQMTGNNFFNDDLKEKIADRFKALNVNVTVGTRRFDDMTSQDHFYENEKAPEDDPWCLDLLRKIYPDADLTNQRIVREKLQDYATDYPTTSLLYFARDILNPPTSSVLGYTYGMPANGHSNRGKFSVIFVKRIKDQYNEEWENKVITETTLHELGHNWGGIAYQNLNFTDNDEHIKWHNGIDTWQTCIMNTLVRNSAGVPSEQSKTIIDKASFCDGHIQRGTNICWEKKQYTAVGQSSNKEMPNWGQYVDLPKKLVMEIQIDSSAYYMGKMINLLVKITNLTDSTLEYYTPEFHLIDNKTKLEKRATGPTGGESRDPILSGQTTYHTYSLLRYYYYDENDDQNFISITPNLKPGSYAFNTTISLKNGETVKSNIVEFEVLPLREEDQKYFNMLNTLENRTLEEKRTNYENAKGTFFEYEFFTEYVHAAVWYKIMTGNGDTTREATELILQYLSKYPNSGFARSYIHACFSKAHPYNKFDDKTIFLFKKAGGWSSLIFNSIYQRRKNEK